MSWVNEISSEYSLTDYQISRFETLLGLLGSISDRNLTAVTGEKNIIDFHFRDCLSILAFQEFVRAEKIVDIGSGAGFPGLPLAIARPDKSFSLLEAISKKCDFIDEVVEVLGIDNVATVRSRSEEAALGEMRDAYDLAVARAVGPLAVVIEYVLPLVKPGGAVLLQRGAREEGDETTAAAVADLLGGRLDRIESVHPYPGSKNLHIWVLSKLIPTPKRFPRRPGMAKKRPLA